MARILVIDDEPGYRSAAKRALELDGHEVRTAADGELGLELLRAEPADLVIVDLFMPRKTGLATIRALRREMHSIPVIAISGAPPDARGNLLEVAGMIGAARSLPKPFTVDELAAVTREVLASATAR